MQTYCLGAKPAETVLPHYRSLECEGGNVDVPNNYSWMAVEPTKICWQEHACKKDIFGQEKTPIWNKHVSQTQTVFLQRSHLGRSCFLINGESGNF